MKVLIICVCAYDSTLTVQVTKLVPMDVQMRSLSPRLNSSIPEHGIKDTSGLTCGYCVTKHLVVKTFDLGVGGGEMA